MLLAAKKCSSLRTQALLAGLCANTTLSKQGLHKRLGLRASLFLQSCLEHLLATLFSARPLVSASSFGRILVQDSTCLSLLPRLAKSFPGPSNQSGKPQACLRIQSLYDLLAERFLWFRLTAFTRNDQAAANDVLAQLQPNDLLLRDLGYFTLAAFRTIAVQGACFLSRLRYNIPLFHPVTHDPLDLHSKLRADSSLDIPIQLGNNGTLLVRLVAFPLSEAAANDRRRRARANRDKRLCHSAHYMYLLGWDIFITNADAQQLPLDVIAKLYRLRWRIEIIFKSWKSGWGLMLGARLGMRQLEALIYGLLMLAVLTHHQFFCTHATPTPSTPFASHQVKPLSLLRVTEFLSNMLPLLFFAALSPPQLAQRLLLQLNTHARYEPRRRKNYVDLKSECLG